MKATYFSTRALTQGAIVAALYVALTFVSAFFGLSSQVVQLRLSEVLCVLPIFMPAAIPGLFVGCLLANALTGCVVLDIVFGSVATLIGAVGTYLLRKHPRLALLPPILANTIIVPFVLRYGYGAPDAIWFMMATVGLGEILSVGVLGTIFYQAIHKKAAALAKI